MSGDQVTEAGRRWLELLDRDVQQPRCRCGATWYGFRDTECRPICAQCGAAIRKQGNAR